MARSKKRNVDEIYDLKKIIKEKDETIKFLERRLRKEEKQDKKLQKNVSKVKEVVIPVDQDTCLACNKGKLEFISLGFRTIIVCQHCKERKIIKNG